MSSSIFEYTPPKTLDEFMMDDSRLRFIRGPIGSAKSTACAMELFRRACEQEPDADGMRRTRMVIVRNTLPQLRTTCLETIRGLFRDFMTYKVSENKITIEVNDVYSEWYLFSIDTEDNINKLLSFEITMGWISEFREISPEIVQAVYSRCGRFPSKIHGGATFHGIIAETNSFSEDSPWYELLELDRPKNWGYHIQPGGREPDAENVENLPDDYYADMVESNTEDWVDQYIDNHISSSLAGAAVFKKSFVPEFHIAESLQATLSNSLVIGLDTGRHPAAIIGQLDAWGRVLVLGEAYAEGTGMENFIKTVLRPMVVEKWGNIRCFAIVDPAGKQRSQIGEESVIEAIKRLGFSARPASTNNIDPRLRAVEKLLLSSVNGKAAILIDGSACPMLVRSLKHDYRYKRKKASGELDESPEKNHPASDLCDALQYLALGITNNLMGREIRGETYERRPPIPVGAWT